MDAEDRLRRRLERERRARHEAEAITERVTGELYASKMQLEQANAELQALNESLREFVAIASHDLRNPLTSVLGLAATLRQHRGTFDPEQEQQFLEMIERQGQHMARMVEDLLTVSKIESGALDTRAEVVRLREAIDRVVEEFGETAREVAVDAEDLAAAVDPDHLERILSNYVGNALTYGRPPVAVRAGESGSWVEVRVCDHGEGVPDELRTRLFERFSRGDASRSSGGTGLGLSIVRGLARANGGDAWYEPNLPHGSVFGVRLPRASN